MKQNKEIEAFIKAYSIWISEFQMCADWHTGINSIVVQILR